MTRPDELSQEHWEALLDAAPAIAIGVAAAAGSGTQTEAELSAFVELVERSAVDADPGTLLGRLTADVHGRLAGGWLAETDDPLTDGLQAARRAGAILAVAAEPHEADAIRGWYLEGARVVARSTREGGVLGVGSEQVSRHEDETIKAIADALGEDVEPPAGP